MTNLAVRVIPVLVSGELEQRLLGLEGLLLLLACRSLLGNDGDALLGDPLGGCLFVGGGGGAGCGHGRLGLGLPVGRLLLRLAVGGLAAEHVALGLADLEQAANKKKQKLGVGRAHLAVHLGLHLGGG